MFLQNNKGRPLEKKWHIARLVTAMLVLALSFAFCSTVVTPQRVLAKKTTSKKKKPKPKPSTPPKPNTPANQDNKPSTVYKNKYTTITGVEHGASVSIQIDAYKKGKSQEKIDSVSASVDNGSTVTLSPRGNDAGIGSVTASRSGSTVTIHVAMYIRRYWTPNVVINTRSIERGYTLQGFNNGLECGAGLTDTDNGNSVSPLKENKYYEASWSKDNLWFRNLGDGDKCASYSLNWYRWRRNISYNSNGGSPTPGTTQYYGDKAWRASAPSLEGWTFKGWNRNNTLYQPGKEIPGDFDDGANLYYTASWVDDTPPAVSISSYSNWTNNFALKERAVVTVRAGDRGTGLGAVTLYRRHINSPNEQWQAVKAWNGNGTKNDQTYTYQEDEDGVWTYCAVASDNSTDSPDSTTGEVITRVDKTAPKITAPTTGDRAAMYQRRFSGANLFGASRGEGTDNSGHYQVVKANTWHYFDQAAMQEYVTDTTSANDTSGLSSVKLYVLVGSRELPYKTCCLTYGDNSTKDATLNFDAVQIHEGLYSGDSSNFSPSDLEGKTAQPTWKIKGYYLVAYDHAGNRFATIISSKTDMNGLPLEVDKDDGGGADGNHIIFRRRIDGGSLIDAIGLEKKQLEENAKKATKYD